MADIRLSAFADEYSPELDLQLKGLSELGINCIEPRFFGKLNVSELSEEQAKQIAGKLEKNGICVYSVGSPLGKISVDDNFDTHMELARQTFRNAKILGATRVRMFSFYIPKDKTRKECRDEVISRLSALLDLADEYGLTLCHENEGGIYGESPECCFDILSALGGRLRCVFDMGNFLLCGYNPYPEAYNLLKGYIDYFHIKDGLSAGAIVPPGLGEARIKEILAAYASENNSFLVTLEPHLETFSGLNRLTDTKFDNPYKFETPEAAFIFAGKKLKEIVEDI